MSMMTKLSNVELGDLVIINTGILGKLAYRVTNDFLHIKLENIENGFEYNEVFSSLDDLQVFIEKHSNIIKLVPLH
ncbi:hypothetical protein [Cytobacillus oceanisediminis]|uniref:hypothetical protein n=1 Tax=Cytobacillus oceanisediminis TaxID=665099 RepID=UPI001FB23370|nr:hypothetical protein [Cytobacillus oceanisediminis]